MVKFSKQELSFIVKMFEARKDLEHFKDSKSRMEVWYFKKIYAN